MKSVTLTLGALAVCISSACYATTNDSLSSEQTIQFLKQQVRSSSSVGNSVRSMIARYPENSVSIVEVALDTYPDRFRQIISASVSAQPTFADEFLKLAIERDLAPATDLLTLAINAEPSYAEFSTEAACKFSPEDFMAIVKTAVNAQPDSADQIAKTLARSYPSKALDILVATIQEVPVVGKYVVDALLALFPEDSEESQSMILISVEQLATHPEELDRLIALANQRGIEQTLVMNSAEKGGLSNEEAKLALASYYK